MLARSVRCTLPFDREVGIPVALKRLAWLDPNVALGFKREFPAVADTSRPNLASVYELFHDEQGGYFAMELVSGWPHARDTFRRPAAVWIWRRSMPPRAPRLCKRSP